MKISGVNKFSDFSLVYGKMQEPGPIEPSFDMHLNYLGQSNYPILNCLRVQDRCGCSNWLDGS